MPRDKRQLLEDIAIVILSVFAAVFIAKSGFIHRFVEIAGGFFYLGSFFAGMFFTSIFTTAPAIAILGEFSQTYPIPLVAFIGGLGAMLGDYIIFRFARDRVAEDVRYVVSHTPLKRMNKIFETKIVRYLTPFIGALIIASPLPDETGLVLLGFSRISTVLFLPLSFAMNSAGIYIIGLVARAVGW